MAIIVGDTHGNVEKVRAFLAYKPDNLHVALGDYLDSFYEPPERQLEALQFLIDSQAVLLWGNHELHYLSTSICQFAGYNFDWAERFGKVLDAHRQRFLTAYAVDGWLCTHAGCAVDLAGGCTDVVELAERLNAEFAKSVDSHKMDGIFRIGYDRGGPSLTCGGIFWFDWRQEGDLLGLAPIPQIFGHTESKEPVKGKGWYCLDTTNSAEVCWVYDTEINDLVRLKTPLRRVIIG